MPTIKIMGAPLFYQSPHVVNESAPGARILFLHGPGVDHRLFEEQLHFFAAAHTPIALDLPGHGRSAGEAAEGVTDSARVVKAFVDALRLAPVILCGHALGGAIALEYTYNHPRDVEGLALVDMGVTFPWATDAAAALAADPAAYRQRNGRRGLSEGAREQAVELLTTARMETPVQSAIRDLASAAEWDATVRLSAVHTPTLIVFGEEDPLLDQANELLGAMPHASFDTIPLARHFPHLEMPDMFNDTLNRFVTIIPDLTPTAGGE